MKLEKTGVGYEANFKPKSLKFEIGDPSILIGIVRDKLYSDKVRVFIQEYISNARDANREAGQPDWNLDITAPSKVEPYFKVRDYGPGLSPERIQNVFVKFGASTKRKTDDYIGGFGIGAKSAWAYTDSFVVKSFHNGTETHYLCHLGTDHDGSADILYESTTEQPNGVEIQVQVKEKDLHYANNVLNELIKFWPQKPRVFGIDAQFKPSYDYDKVKLIEILPETGIGYLEHSRTGMEVKIVLDGIPYEMPNSILRNVLSGKAPRTWFICAETGDLSVAANREQLEINERLHNWIERKTIQFFESLILRHQQVLDDGDFFKYVKFLKEFDGTFSIALEKSDVPEGSPSAGLIKKIFKIKKQFIERNFIRTALNKKYKKTTRRILQTLDMGTYEDLVSPSRAAQKTPQEILNSLTHPLVYFEKEKIWTYGDRVFPDGLYGVPLIVKAETISNRGSIYSRRTGSRYFQKIVYCWGEKHQQGPPGERWFVLHAEDLIPEPPVEGAYIAPEILFNDQGWKLERIKRNTNQIRKTPHFIIDTPSVPLGFFAFSKICGPLTENIKKRVYMSSSDRVVRKTGSLRPISLHRNGQELYFGDYQEASTYEDLISKSKGVVYLWTSDNKGSLSSDFLKISSRVTLNDWILLQLSKTAHKYLNEKYPKKPIVHYKDWVKEWAIKDETSFTPQELEFIVFQWSKDKYKEAHGIICDIFRHRNGKRCYLVERDTEQIKTVSKEYYEFINEVQRIKEVADRNPSLAHFAYNYKKKVTLQQLKKQKLFNLREKLLKKYPMLPIIEKAISEGDIASEVLFHYLKGPEAFNKYMKKDLKEDATKWLAR